MLPENIDRFVDRLCALYPNRQVARNTIKSGSSGWVASLNMEEAWSDNPERIRWLP